MAREEKKRNYQKELDQEIEKIKRDDKVPTLLLHSCCAPCSSYVLEYLSNYFKITVFYYNPNIYPQQEYEKRVLEQQHFIQSLPAKYPVEFCGGRYEQEEFYSGIRGLEKSERAGSAVMPVMSCGFVKQHGLQNNRDMIISPLHCPSVL